MADTLAERVGPITSGLEKFTVRGSADFSAAMAQLALECEVAPGAILEEPLSSRTAENAEEVAALLEPRGIRSITLVTSALLAIIALRSPPLRARVRAALSSPDAFLDLRYFLLNSFVELLLLGSERHGERGSLPAAHGVHGE